MFRKRLARIAVALITATVLAEIAVPTCAAPPFCPHVIGFTTNIENWAASAPWVKVLYWRDIITAKNHGCKVFYRPYEIPNHDDGGCGDGIGMANNVLALLANVPRDKWPDAIGYRNEFGGQDTTTTQQFINYYDRLRAGGYSGMIIFGSYSTGVPEPSRWSDPDVVAAVNKADGIETHEYFDLTEAFCHTWLMCRHVRFIEQNSYLLGKPWFIGEAGSDRITAGGCHEDSCNRRGWRHYDCGAQKLSEEQYISELSRYRDLCAPQVVAVFVFQQGDSYWADFDVMGTSVATWMQSTWTSSTGLIAGSVKDTNNNGIPNAVVQTNTGGYSTITDSNGNYVLSNVAPATYDVTATKSGYQSQTQTGKTVTAGQTTTVNFTLTAVPPGAIAGNVRSAAGQNLSGATISTNVGGYTTTTDSNGNYILSNVAVGTYDVTASKTGYISSTQTGKSVNSNQTTTINFTLTTQPFSGIQNKNFEGGFYNDPDVDHQSGNYWHRFSISGISKAGGVYGNYHSPNWSQTIYESNWVAGIYQQATGATVGNNYTASVWVRGSDTNVKFWIGIDPTGGTDAASANVQWSAECIPGTTWTQISKQVAASSGTITMFVKAQNTATINKYAYIDDADLVDNGGGPSTGTLTGNVKDQAGANLSGATVTTNTGGYSATTDANGNYTISNVAAGTYDVTASKSGYNSQTQSGKTVTAGQTTTVNFTITRQTGTLTGNVKDQAGANLSGATVTTNTGGYSATTDANGNYTITNVATGTYDVTASKTGYTSQTQTGKTVNYNQTTTVNFTLTSVSNGTISGNVKNKDGVNIAGATVSTNTGGYSATTDANGNYTISNVAAGTYNVTASKSGYVSEVKNGISVTAGQTTTCNFTNLYIAAQNFDSVPSWTTSYNASWGSSATFSSVAGGQSGNFLQVSRTSQGSSARVIVYNVPANTNITISVYMKCPSYANSYWIESAYRLGNYSAQDFDQNPGNWTLIKKFSNSGGYDNGNGDTWVKYTKTLNTGSYTQISIGYKHGASGCTGPTVGWDTFLMD